MMMMIEMDMNNREEDDRRELDRRDEGDTRNDRLRGQEQHTGGRGGDTGRLHQHGYGPASEIRRQVQVRDRCREIVETRVRSGSDNAFDLGFSCFYLFE